MKKLNVVLVVLILMFSCSKTTETTHLKSNFLLNQIDSKDSGIDFANLIAEDAQHSIISYIYYYNGGGVSAGDVNNDGLTDLYFVSNMGDNKLYLNEGNLKFKDISKKANISGNASWQTGSTMVDINNDGLLDIYVCAVSGVLDFKGHNELFINNGDNTFTESAEEYGLDFTGYSTQSYFFDYDKDDDLDVYIVNHAIHTTISHGKAELRNNRTPLIGDVLLNNNQGKFRDVSDEANIFGGINGYGLSASIADYNNDGWDDIYVCNDFHEDDFFYINNQDGTFKESLNNAFSTISRFSMGSDVADINGDGFQDLITLDMLPKTEHVLKETEGDETMFNLQVHLKKLGYKDQYSRNMLQINNAGDYFQETALFNKVANTDWSWAPLFADFNNDGHLDLFISNGILRRPNGLDFKKYVSSAFKGRSQEDGMAWLFNSIGEMASGKVTNEIYEGNSKKFENKTGEWIENTPNLSNGAIYVDLDLDGDLDIVTNNLGELATIYENTTDSTKNYLSLKFEYKGANKEGIGLKTIVYNNGNAQLKQLFKSRGFLSSIESKLHFGLDNASSIDSIVVIWPNHHYQTIKNPEVNRILKIRYKASDSIYNYKNNLENKQLFKKEDFIKYTHVEDDYNDFVKEKLIPYKISTFGPAIAKGDIDNNGFEDVFIGNSSGKPAQLFMNSGSSFTLVEPLAFKDDANYEDNDAKFFDADNDGDLDLYVASGINKRNIEEFNQDRLYLNMNGTFVRSKNQIPLNTLVTTAVEAYDYNNDGAIDLFIGNHSESKDYGKFVASNLLINDGKGNFLVDPDFELTSKVTSAAWQDINGDNIKDLLVSTEWDAPKIYINSKGKLDLLELPENYNGLWQTISTYDIDSDGDQDILLGNWGLNTKFNLNFDGPVTMYHHDFDKNSVPETLITYNKDGKDYPLNSKDEMAAQMNVINKFYKDHKSYAGKTIQELLPTTTLNMATKSEVHILASGYLKNENGSFIKFVEFPDAFQLAPITSFSDLILKGEPKLLVGGNSFKVNTYHGSYNSLKGLLVKDESNYQSVSSFGMLPFNEQIKQIETIKMKKGNLVLILTNNDEIKVYSYQN